MKKGYFQKNEMVEQLLKVVKQSVQFAISQRNVPSEDEYCEILLCEICSLILLASMSLVRNSYC